MELVKKSKNCYELSASGDMRIAPRVYANPAIATVLENEAAQVENRFSSLRQLQNIAKLSGFLGITTLPDIHPGYGAPIGTVLASDPKEGVLTFAGVGFDINCGVQTLILPLTIKEIEKKKKEFADVLFKEVPAGIGIDGKLKLNPDEIDEVLEKGAAYVVKKGFGTKKDLTLMEENGHIKGARAEFVSDKAKERAARQVGTLGSGNHYCEVQAIEKVFDERIAKAFGLVEGGTVVSIHCGSRALGHQIGTDYLPILDAAVKKYGITIAERELVCAPFMSEEGQQYFGAVNAASNGAFANRRVIGELVRRTTTKIFGVGEKEVKMLYDVGHNNAKLERHAVDGKKRKILVQRKGSTRGFGPKREEVPAVYRKVGQPVMVGGTMGTHSFILCGTDIAMRETFGSTIHGAGRVMSRTAALTQWTGQGILEELAKKGIVVKARSLKGLPEEAPLAYKDVVSVVDVMHSLGISQKVAKLKPLICIKG